MANTNVSHSEVKAICDSLECSPVSQFSDSPYGGPANLTPKNVKGHAASQGGGSTSGTLGMKSLKSTKVPGYHKKFAKKATQV